MKPDDDCCPEIVPFEDRARHEFQRPDIATPADPRGGFRHNPEFEINGAYDGGHIWNSRSGNHTNRFVNN